MADLIQLDGSLDFSGGVDSIKVTTIQSEQNPNGLARNQLAWLNNATVRDGGITQRTGWQDLAEIIDQSGFYQGGFMYQPRDGSNPYLLLVISGHLYMVIPDLPSITNLSAQFGLNLPATAAHCYFCQAEEFLIIQAGDEKTLPLFWDGALLRQSKGITNQAVAPGTPGVNEIPAAAAMDYYMGRVWYAQGRQISGGDIVGGNSGTLAYSFRDAVLNVTENPLVLGGDGFTIPSQDGAIRAVFHTAQLDASLGQGTLYLGTRRAVYQLQVPVTRTGWIAANNNNQPLLTVAQLINGPVNDRAVVPINGDAYYQSIEPAIRSLAIATRFFTQAGNVALSSEVERIMQFSDRSLLSFASGVYFDNRLLQTALPIQRPQGVVHRALVPLDFVPMSSFGSELSPVWEGMYEGLEMYQLFTGDFGGLERAFAIVRSATDQSMHLWELTDADRFENGDNRVQWQIEFPSLTWGQEFLLKKLTGAELWVDKLFGEVIFKMEYRPDGDVCWHPWFEWKKCSARNSCEDVTNPVCYPLTMNRDSYQQSMGLPRPPEDCQNVMGRPSYIGFQFQTRLTVKGWCRVRGLMLQAQSVERAQYSQLVCQTQ